MRARLAVIAVSLSANVALCAVWWQRHYGTTVAPTATLASASDPATPPGFVPDDKMWEHLTGDADDATFVARLRDAGFPSRIGRMLVYQRIRERFAPQLREVAVKEADVPYWLHRLRGYERRLAPRAARQHLRAMKTMPSRDYALFSFGHRARPLQPS